MAPASYDFLCVFLVPSFSLLSVYEFSSIGLRELRALVGQEPPMILLQPVIMISFCLYHFLSILCVCVFSSICLEEIRALAGQDLPMV